MGLLRLVFKKKLCAIRVFPANPRLKNRVETGGMFRRYISGYVSGYVLRVCIGVCFAALLCGNNAYCSMVFLGGFVSGMFRGYVSGNDSGVCFGVCVAGGSNVPPYPSLEHATFGNIHTYIGNEQAKAKQSIANFAG